MSRRKRKSRWSEDSHVKIAVGFTIALIVGTIFTLGHLYPPTVSGVQQSNVAPKK